MKILYIGNKLSKHGVNATTIETLGPLLEQSGMKVHYASSQKNKIFRLFDMLAKTITLGRKSNYILIDTYSTYNFWYAFAVSQLARTLSIKYIPILHGGELPQRLRSCPKLSKMIFSNAFVNVAPSGYLIDAFATQGYSNVIFIPNSIEIADYKFKKRSDLKPKLLWVRAFSRIYNPEMAVQVMSKLKLDFSAVELCMVGPEKDGSMQETKLLAAQLGLKVEFPGKLTKRSWITLSEDYDIFINTTHQDNTPVSVIEAMALGLPIISTNVGGLSFLLDNDKTAVLVNDNDINAMAEGIKTILRNQEFALNLSLNAKAVADGFDSEKVMKKWTEILN